jgi:branched-subunit amino acid ABC-type transport system permease component
MKVLNLTHGSFYLLGGYIGLAVVHSTGSFILAALAGSLAIAVVGVVMGAFPAALPSSRTASGAADFGFLFIFSDLATVIWAATRKRYPNPRCFSPPCNWRVLLSFLSIVHYWLWVGYCCVALVAPGRHAHRRNGARQRR